MEILFDAYQEGVWFQALHPRLSGADVLPFPSGDQVSTPIATVLAFDRPDIILVDAGFPILVVERTVEVPSGHNVGQRFARLVGAARAGVPVVYVAPFSAFKHGGETSGPRYMNLRLPAALRAVSAIEDAAATLIRWPTDDNFEVRHDPETDGRIRQYLEMFFEGHAKYDLPGLNQSIIDSSFQREQQAEVETFAATVKRAGVYDSPPPSVKTIDTRLVQRAAERSLDLHLPESVIYRIGMKYIRSDPYTGGAMLYSYLYCGGLSSRIRNLILWFPEITIEMWRLARGSGDANKHIRLYRMLADVIQFADGFLARDEL